MENITIGQIKSAVGIITVIGTFIFGIYKWYKKIIGDKFVKIDNRFTTVEKRLDYVESKEEEYNREVQNSKDEREILLRGELAALKGLKEICQIDAVSDSINEIEKYMMKETHK